MISAINNCGCSNSSACYTNSRCGGDSCDSCSTYTTCDSGSTCTGSRNSSCDTCGWANWGSWNATGRNCSGSCFARSLIGQLGSLYNTRVHITTFTCTLDVVLLDVCGEFIRVLDYCNGKIYLLRIDCICMIEQPIVPDC